MNGAWFCLLAFLWLYSPICVSSTACGQDFSMVGGGITITSPNWPLSYSDNLRCVWNVRPHVVDNVYITFTDVALEDCNDFILIIHERNGVGIANVKVCNNEPQKLFQLSLGGEDNLRVEFFSNHNIVSRGFRMKIQLGLRKDFRLTDTGDADRKCLNGGSLHGDTTSWICSCPPGFKGLRCQEACDPGRYGNSCDKECSGDFNGCVSQNICFVPPEQFTREPICSCSSGLKGLYCNEVCSPGEYGANCTQRCGYCRGHSHCDPFSGHCSQGCEPGFYRPYCHERLTHYIGKVDVTNTSRNSFGGYIHMAPEQISGEGSVQMFELQFKESTSPDWSIGVVGALCDAGVDACGLPFSVDGLRPNSTLHVRVLLLDEDLNSFTQVPYIVIHTEGERQVSNLAVSDVSARSLLVSWTSPTKEGLFTVMYECESLLACGGETCDAANGILMVANDSVLLEGLVPFAKYRITVARDDEAETVQVTTRMAVPSTTVSGLEASLVTLVTAVVRWRPAIYCGELNGPASKFAWELHRGDGSAGEPAGGNASSQPLLSGTTNTMVVLLRDLTPLTKYELRVNIMNVMGSSPNHWAKLPFQTMHSLPDEPRSLAAYRRSATAVYVRWRPPARPGGELRRYVVEVQGPGVNRNETVMPTMACSAKPDYTCHVVAGLQPGKAYSVAVSAVNQFGDETGPPASILVPAKLGVPTAPQSFSIKEFRTRSVVLQWQLPDLINSDLHYFEVVVHGTFEAPRRIDVQAKEEKLWYECTVDGLAPGAAYSVSVRCGPFGEVASLHFYTLEKDGQ